MLENRAGAVERIVDWWNAFDTAVDLERIVQRDRPLQVKNVEPIDRKAQLLGFAELDRVIKAEIQVIGRRRTTAADRVSDTAVAADVRKIRNDRNT